VIRSYFRSRYVFMHRKVRSGWGNVAYISRQETHPTTIYKWVVRPLDTRWGLKHRPSASPLQYFTLKGLLKYEARLIKLHLLPTSSSKAFLHLFDSKPLFQHYIFHIHTVHIDIIRVLFILQLMQKWIVWNTILKFTLKFTLKQLRHVSVQSHHHQGAHYSCSLKIQLLK
jgi:hypothetical protein